MNSEINECVQLAYIYFLIKNFYTQFRCGIKNDDLHGGTHQNVNPRVLCLPRLRLGRHRLPWVDILMCSSMVGHHFYNIAFKKGAYLVIFTHFEGNMTNVNLEWRILRVTFVMLTAKNVTTRKVNDLQRRKLEY